ncbi:hypothetical protein KF840_08475 [bacterium]|nr:hypothetical protein [bacterium]
MRWQVYGSNGQMHASPEPVIARFPRRAPADWIRNRRVKSIVDPRRAVAPVNCHHFAYRGGEVAVDETGERVRPIPRPRFKKELRPLYRLLGPAVRYFDPFAADSTSSKISVEQLRINHYPIKSREEFARKSRMMEGTRRYDSVDYFAYHDRNDVFDPILSRYLPHLGRTSSLTQSSVSPPG